jgi:hypothetical protein
MAMNATALFCTLIITATVLGSQSGGTTIQGGTAIQGDALVQYVDRAVKGDRLDFAQPHLARPTSARPKLPAGCDAIVSPLASRDLAGVAAQCDS